MVRKTFIINSNLSSITLHEILRFTKAKVTKFRFIPDNLTNVSAICVNVSQISQNSLISSTNGFVAYFFMIPFINNNSVPFVSSDVVDMWDYVSDNLVEINRLVISVTNENGQAITFNNSTLTIEILFE